MFIYRCFTNVLTLDRAGLRKKGFLPFLQQVETLLKAFRGIRLLLFFFKISLRVLIFEAEEMDTQ